MKTILLLLTASLFATDLFLNPATTDNALAASENPAGLATYRSANAAITGSFNTDSFFCGAVSFGGFGIGATAAPGRTSFQLANGFRMAPGVFGGMRTAYVDVPGEDYYNYDLGILLRPFHFLSLGANTEDFIHGGTGAAMSIRAGAGLRLLDDIIFSAATRYTDCFSRPEIGLEIMLGGINLVGHADLQDKIFRTGLSFSVPTLEAGILYPFKGKSGRQFSVWSGLDRKTSVIRLPKKTAVISIAGSFQDLEPEFTLFGGNNAIQLSQVLSQLRNAARDEDVGMVILKIGDISSGLGMVEEVRKAVLDLRLAHKRTLAFLENVSLSEYYLATAADEIVVEPMSAWTAAGVSAEVAFFKGTFDKIGVKAEFERVGPYKSAVEPLTQDTMSDAFRENETALLASIYNQIVDAIASARSVDHDTLVGVLDRGTLPLKEAITKGLIDKTGYFNDLVAANSGKGEKSLDLLDRTYYGDGWRKKKRIAVLNATGTLVSGESFTDFFSGETFLGSETVAGILKKLRLDRNIRAVVLRINSPGGSGVASDVIWREVQRLKEAGKPVVASLGDVAASGGYYIACNADTIFCSEGSIVGSIGVFAGKFVLKDLYDKIGMRKEILKFGRNADAFSDYHGFTDEQRQLLKGSIEEFYSGFVDRVAVGRRISRDSVDNLGKGRVFTGTQAKANGLVDEIGGLAEAIEAAKLRAGFSEYEIPDIEVYPKPRTFINTMLEANDMESRLSRNFFRAFASLNSEGVLAMMPYRVTFK
ncbi:MAG: signal peptide peptidase SppA [Fibrobacterota bacterium]